MGRPAFDVVVALLVFGEERSWLSAMLGTCFFRHVLLFRRVNMRGLKTVWPMLALLFGT